MTPKKPNTNRWPARSLAPAILMACLLFSGCAYLDEAVTASDGTVSYQRLCRAQGFGRDLSYEKTDANTFAFPSATVIMPDGTQFSGTNVVVTSKSSKAISGKSNAAGVISAGAQLMGAAANLSPF